MANGDGGPPLGRELEIADLLKFIRDSKIAGVVFITADVHYAAAHYYDPAQAKFTEFTPFWEFVAGPAHAGTFGPGKLDATFGPQLKFLGIPPRHEAKPSALRRLAVLWHARDRRRDQSAHRQPVQRRRKKPLQRPAAAFTSLTRAKKSAFSFAGASGLWIDAARVIH